MSNFTERKTPAEIQAKLADLNRQFPGERKKKFVDRDPEFNRRRQEISNLGRSVEEIITQTKKGGQFNG